MPGWQKKRKFEKCLRSRPKLQLSLESATLLLKALDSLSVLTRFPLCSLNENMLFIFVNFLVVQRVFQPRFPGSPLGRSWRLHFLRCIEFVFRIQKVGSASGFFVESSRAAPGV